MRFVNLFWPKSLYSQILMAAAVALLIAQIINAVFLLGGLRERGVNEASNILINSAAFRLQTTGFEEQERAESRQERRAQRRKRREERRSLGGIGIRNLDYIRSKQPLIINGFSQDDALSRRASSIMSVDAIIGKGPIAQLPPELKGRIFNRQNRRYLRGPDANIPDEAVIISFQSNGEWVYAARPIRPLSNRAVWALIIQTLFLYIILLSILALVARHISKPLDRLKESIAHFGSNNLGYEIEAKGPHDVRTLIDNYNDMRSRISALLSEKDVMLGAIGHDLKTPLASLRVRVENVEDDDERMKMIGSIDDMNVMLNDILTLARLGKSSEELQNTNIAALIEAVVDDFPEKSDVIQYDAMAMDCDAHIKPALMRRALRNIIENALRYAGGVDIKLQVEADDIIICVEDEGPGIAVDKLDLVLEPFQRGDASRNSSSGGSGLGLTIARAIARAHDGDLTIRNLKPKGLLVQISIPR